MIPRKINSHLVLFDCITCDKCIPVCPNDANFIYETPPVDLHYRDVEVAPRRHDPRSRRRATLRRRPQGTDRQLRRLLQPLRQLRHVLPRVGRPVPEEAELLRQPRIIRRRRDPRRLPPRRRARQLHASRPHRRRALPPAKGGHKRHVLLLRRHCNARNANSRAIGLAASSPRPATSHRVDIGRFHTLVALLTGITSPARVHQINTRLLAAS